MPLRRTRWLRLSSVRSLVVAGVGSVALAGSFAPHLIAQTPSANQPNPATTQGFKGVVEPSDGRWLVDQRGREYFVIAAPRRENAYAWVTDDHTRVRLAHGLEWDVVSYDDHNFHVKVYRSTSEARPVVSREPTAEERERSAASYRVAATPGQGLEFRSFSAGLPQRGQWRNDFDIADLNGDGRLDIVFGPARKSSRRVPTIFLGDGAGGWKPWAESSFPPLPFDYGDVKVGDLNGDGIPDVVVASHLKGIVALIGNGRGRFTAWSEGIDFGTQQSGHAPFTARAITIADWNGDGRPDVLALGEGPSVAGRPGPGSSAPGFQGGSRGAVIYLNQGEGKWGKVAVPASRSFGSSIVAADFDRDGRMDFVAGSDRWGFTALLNLGQADGTWKETPLPALRPEGIYRAVATADFDRDGRPDLVVSFLTREHGIFRSGVDVLLNRATGWERRTLGVVEERMTIYRVATGDLDGDGHADVVAVDGNGALWVFRGDGTGGFTREPAPEVIRGERCQGYGLRLVDLDRDGADEIVVSFASEAAAQGPYSKEVVCPSEGGLQAWKVVRKRLADSNASARQP